MPDGDRNSKFWHAAFWLGVTSFFLGAFGYFRQDGISARTFYETVQLLLLNAEAVTQESNLILKAAQFVAGVMWLAFGVGTAIYVWDTAKRKVVSIQGGHTVVLGRGVTAEAILGECTNEPVESVDIPQDWPTLIRAKYIVAASDDDSENLAAAARALQANRDHSENTEIFVHISNIRLRAVLRRDRAFRAEDRSPRVTIFNRHDYVARTLFRKFPLDHKPIREDDPREVRLAVIGFDALGEAIAVRAAHLGHFANQKRLSILVVDPQAHARMEAFLTRYPYWHEVVDCEVLEGDPANPSVLVTIANYLKAPDTIPMAVVAFADDGAALPAAFDLVHHTGELVPLVVVPASAAGVALLQGGKDWPSKISIFGDARAREVGRSWRDDELDQPAKAAHRAYIAGLRKEEREDPHNRSVVPWEELDDDLVESNRYFADHIPVKRRAVAGRAPLQKDDLDLLSKMEHRRWMAERRLGGWRYGPVKDVQARISPGLQEWQYLTEAEQEKDRTAVKSVLDLIEKAE